MVRPITEEATSNPTCSGLSCIKGFRIGRMTDRLPMSKASMINAPASNDTKAQV